MGRRGRTRHDEDPFAVLGVPTTADSSEVAAARRRLAKAAHPDAGGSIAAMQRLNDAADRALDALAEPTGAPADRTGGREPTRSRPSPTYRGGAIRHDHPSFTVEALPVDAFEGLLIAASWLGEVVDEDPPYLLEVVLGDSTPAWCRLQLVPDAGASTVSLTVARLPGAPIPDIDDVRDQWIRALNELDWSDLDPTQQRPS